MVCLHISGATRAGSSIDRDTAQLLIAEIWSCREKNEDLQIAARKILKNAKSVEVQLKNLLDVLGRV